MKRIALVTLCLVMALNVSAAAQDVGSDAVQAEDGESATRTYWIFLTTGKSVAGVPREEIAEMQQAHLANFGKLAQAGKLLTAGPMRDPEGTLRGIVVIQAKDAAELAEMFEPDPYVSNGYMNVERQLCELSIGRFTANLNEQGMDEMRIAVVTGDAKNKSWPTSDQLQQLSEADGVQLALSAQFQDEGARQGILIFRSNDDEKIKAALNELPVFQESEEVSYALMPQFLGKGAIEKVEGLAQDRR